MESEGSHGAKLGVDEQKPDKRPDPRGIQQWMENPKVTRNWERCIWRRPREG
jgi:hypothetical protein